MFFFHLPLVILCRDMSGQSGHGVFIGFQLSRHFLSLSGQSGQICVITAHGVPPFQIIHDQYPIVFG